MLLIFKHQVPAIVLLVVVFIVVQLTLGVAIPTDHRKHAQRRHGQLSDEEHYHGGGEHNVDYDHEAFLGGDEQADEFDQLTPEESKARLTKIIERMDSNHDGNITETELKAWIFQSQHRYLDEDVQRQWNTHTGNKPDAKVITWESFKLKTYGFLEEAHKQPDDMNTYHNMLKFVYCFGLWNLFINFLCLPL